MSDFEKWTLILQALVAVLTLSNLVYLHVQARAMANQIAVAQHGNKAQSALALVNFLQSAEARTARDAVRSRLASKHHSQWDEEERRHASLVCANYDVTAALLRSGLAPVDLIVANWATSILHCHQILAPYVAEQRVRIGGDSGYWNNFDWLQKEAAKQRKS
jgi:hypothetical protein